MKNKTQLRIEDFLKEFSLLSQKYGMLIDANGNQSEDAPLSLYIRSGKSPKYEKAGCLYYSFEGKDEQSVYNFDLKNSVLQDTFNELNIPLNLMGDVQMTDEKFLKDVEDSYGK